METYDVIIVGAGPAGISTALHLQQMAPDLAARTLILEKARHPRQKICAGGILPDGVRILGDLGLDIRSVPSVSINCVHFGFGGQGLTAEETANEPFNFYTVLREDFDGWLVTVARERGLAIQEEMQVRQIRPGRDAVEVLTPGPVYRAQVVVGADGAHSIVRRAIAHNGKSRYARTLLLWTSLAIPEHRERGVYFDFQCIPWGVPGYVWDFPTVIRGQHLRCWGIYDSNAVPIGKKPRLREALERTLARYGYRLEDHPIYGGAIHLFDPKNVFSAPRVLLVGDAAGVDILFGEGISPALGYGKIAAQAIADAFSRGNFSFQDYRQRVVRSSLGGMLLRRARIASLLYRLDSPVLQQFIWRRLTGAVQWAIRRMMNWAAP